MKARVKKSVVSNEKGETVKEEEGWAQYLGSVLGIAGTTLVTYACKLSTTPQFTRELPL